MDEERHLAARPQYVPVALQTEDRLAAIEQGPEQGLGGRGGPGAEEPVMELLEERAHEPPTGQRPRL